MGKIYEKGLILFFFTKSIAFWVQRRVMVRWSTRLTIFSFSMRGVFHLVRVDSGSFREYPCRHGALWLPLVVRVIHIVGIRIP